MSKNVIVHQDGAPIYNINLTNDFQGLEALCKSSQLENKKVCIISDSNVSQYHLNSIMEIMTSLAGKVNTYVFPAGEDSKNLDTAKAVYEHLILEKYDRKDILIALGGGVVGDLTGFVAATYLRGISFYQIPTSLLAMVDSSIGGKTGVDFDAYKNMVGAFHQPQGVYINLDTLSTLQDREFYSGMGEIIKHGLIKDRGYYIWLKENANKIIDRNPYVLKEMVYRSCVIKKNVVENDFKEAGERALLNFGHTIGHSVEKLMNFQLLHGECVAIGIVAAAYISYRKDMITLEDLEDIKDTLSLYRLPVNISGIDHQETLEALKSDKKMIGDRINFILLNEIGKAVIDSNVTDEDILEALHYITC